MRPSFHPLLHRRHFLSGLAAAAGAMGIRVPSALAAEWELQTREDDYDRTAKLASNENNHGPSEAVLQAMMKAFTYATRYE